MDIFCDAFSLTRIKKEQLKNERRKDVQLWRCLRRARRAFTPKRREKHRLRPKPLWTLPFFRRFGLCLPLKEPRITKPFVVVTVWHWTRLEEEKVHLLKKKKKKKKQGMKRYKRCEKKNEWCFYESKTSRTSHRDRRDRPWRNASLDSRNRV